MTHDRLEMNAGVPILLYPKVGGAATVTGANMSAQQGVHLKIGELFYVGALGDVYISGQLKVNGNLLVSGNIDSSDGSTGTIGGGAW